MKEAPSVMRRNSKPKFVQANLGLRNFKVDERFALFVIRGALIVFVMRGSLIVVRIIPDWKTLTLSLPARAGFTPHLI